MIQNRTEILQLIAKGKNNTEISNETGHSRTLIRKIRNDLENGTLFTQKSKIGRPTIITDDIVDRVRSMTQNNRRMSTKDIANILSENNHISYGTVYTIRKQIGFNFLPPINTFYISQAQRDARLQFSKFHLDNKTDWTKVLFTDESAFYLDNNHRWLWRRRGELCNEIIREKKKYTPKVMIFGGISYHWKTPLIIVKGNIDAEVYIDDCIDQSGLIPEMNRIYGAREWMLLQDGAKPHTCKTTISYLRDYCKLVENWPANSPDLNVIENLWAIIKKRVESLQPDSIDSLIEAIQDVWNNLSMELIHNLIDSMTDRLQRVVDNQGGPNGY